MCLWKPRPRDGAIPLAVFLAVLLVAAPGCSKKSRTTAPGNPRGYRLGFSWFLPRPELSLALQAIDASRARSDWARILSAPTWARRSRCSCSRVTGRR